MLLSRTDFLGAIATMSDEKQTHVFYGVFCCLLSNTLTYFKNITFKDRINITFKDKDKHNIQR